MVDCVDEFGAEGGDLVTEVRMMAGEVGVVFLVLGVAHPAASGVGESAHFIVEKGRGE